MDEDARIALANLLDALANGDTITLGEFGDNATAQDADEQAVWLRDRADELRAVGA